MSGCQPRKHQADHDDVDERLLCLGEDLIVPAHPAMATTPGEGALHHPAAGEHLKSRARRRLTTRRDPGPGRASLGNLDRETGFPLGKALEGAPVRLIDPEVVTLRIAHPDPFHDQFPAITVMDIRGMHPHCQDQPERVYQEMALAPVDPLGAVISPDPPFSVIRTD